MELEAKVKEILEQVRPMLQADGGDVEFLGITDDNVVKVSLRGACGSCRTAMATAIPITSAPYPQRR